MHFHKTHDAPCGLSMLVKCYSPTMDLIAFVLEDDDQQVHVHRNNNFQRLFTVKINCTKSVEGYSITVACWRPDGKLLAVGCEDGSLHLVDIESSSVSFACNTESSILNLSWIEQNFSLETNDMFLWEKKALPLIKLEDPNTLAMTFDTEQVETESVIPVDVPDTTMLQHPLFHFDRLTVLVVTTESEIQLRSNGSFLFLRLSTNNPPVWASLTTDLDKLSFVVSTEEVSALKVIQDNIFAPYTVNDLSKCGKQWMHVHRMLQGEDMADGCLTHMEECWSSFYQTHYLPMFEKLRHQMEQECVDTDLCQAFSQILVSGTVDHPTMQWISTIATEQHLVKLLRQLQLIHHTLRKYAVDHLQRYLEHTSLRLSSVLSRHDPQHVELLAQVSKLLLETCEGGSFKIDDHISSIQHMLHWFRQIHLRVCGKTSGRASTQQQAQQPLPMETITNSRIVKYLRTSGFEDGRDSVGEIITTLRNGFEKVSTTVEQVFSKLCDQVSESYTRRSLANVSEYSVIPPEATHVDTDGHQFIALRHELYVILLRITSRTHIETCTIELEQLSKCHSVHFYGQDSLFCIGNVEQEDEQFVRMIMVSLEEVEWLPFSEFGECFMNAVPANVSKDRDIRGVSFTEIDSVAVGASRGLACIILRETDRPSKNMYLFDLEDEEEEAENAEEEENAEEQQMDGEDSVMME
jgi:hypothetical protein